MTRDLQSGLAAIAPLATSRATRCLASGIGINPEAPEATLPALLVGASNKMGKGCDALNAGLVFVGIVFIISIL